MATLRFCPPDRGFLQDGGLQPHEPGGLLHPAVHLIGVQPHVFGAEGDILIDGLLKKLVFRVLEHQPHLAAHLPGAPLARPDIPAVKEHLPGRGPEQAVEVLD